MSQAVMKALESRPEAGTAWRYGGIGRQAFRPAGEVGADAARASGHRGRGTARVQWSRFHGGDPGSGLQPARRPPTTHGGPSPTRLA